MAKTDLMSKFSLKNVTIQSLLSPFYELLGGNFYDEIELNMNQVSPKPACRPPTFAGVPGTGDSVEYSGQHATITIFTNIPTLYIYILTFEF